MCLASVMWEGRRQHTVGLEPAAMAPPIAAVTGRPVRDGWPQRCLAGGMLSRAKADAFGGSPYREVASATVVGTRSCRAAWSARHPVKVEVAGSNPVRTAGSPVKFHWGPS